MTDTVNSEISIQLRSFAVFKGGRNGKASKKQLMMPEDLSHILAWTSAAPGSRVLCKPANKLHAWHAAMQVTYLKEFQEGMAETILLI